MTEKIEKRINVKNVSDDEVQEMFEESFRNQLGKYNSIDEIEVKSKKAIGKDIIRVEVTVQGMAGSPTAEDFKSGKVKNASPIKISRADKGCLSFEILPKETVYLNSTEYIITYQSV
jgi:hypothetical protein